MSVLSVVDAPPSNAYQLLKFDFCAPKQCKGCEKPCVNDSELLGHVPSNTKLSTVFEEFRAHVCKVSRQSPYKKNQESLKQQQQDYNLAHKYDISQKQADYNLAHKDEISKKQAVYDWTHREQVSQKQADYNLANKEQISQKQADYNLAHKNKLQIDRLVIRSASNQAHMLPV
jgi:hypothetical protein